MKNIRKLRRFLAVFMVFNFLLGIDNDFKISNLLLIMLNAIAIFIIALYEILKAKN